jgi:hypothetical protein
MLKLVVLVALAGLVASETPTAPQRANLKLAHDEYRKNTKASFITAEPLYKKAVVDFGNTLGSGHFFTKAAKKRYNFLLALDSSKLATEQAFACEDSCSPGGTYTGPGDVAGCTAQYCTQYVSGHNSGFHSRCTAGATGHNYALLECQKTCGICVGKTPYAASELSTSTAGTSHDQCSDGEQNGDETGVDCGGSCACCGVDCVSSETTCTCTPACGNTCKCTDTITITTPAAGCGQACPSATVRTFTGASCPVIQYVFKDGAELKTAVHLWCSNRAAALTTYGHISTHWDTSKVTNMQHLFGDKRWGTMAKNPTWRHYHEGFKTFNDPIGAWDTSRVGNMGQMFMGAAAFNQPLNTWNTSSVWRMANMFNDAAAFNQPLDAWDVSSVKEMSNMFNGATSYNQNLGVWSTPKLVYVYSMFTGATAMTYPVPPMTLSTVGAGVPVGSIIWG